MEKNELISSSAHQYLVDRWGLGYFGINEKGHLSVFPKRHQSGPVIDIFEVVQEMKRKKRGFSGGYSLPRYSQVTNHLH
jgi:arginine decarboxylase